MLIRALLPTPAKALLWSRDGDGKVRGTSEGPEGEGDRYKAR
jgi:hypothetical protein